MKLVLVGISMSMASTAASISSTIDRPQVIAVIVPADEAVPSINRPALIPSLELLERSEAVAMPKFVPPPVKRTPPFMKPLPLIGWKNINCYGGTQARYARG